MLVQETVGIFLQRLLGFFCRATCRSGSPVARAQGGHRSVPLSSAPGPLLTPWNSPWCSAGQLRQLIQWEIHLGKKKPKVSFQVDQLPEPWNCPLPGERMGQDWAWGIAAAANISDAALLGAGSSLCYNTACFPKIFHPFSRSKRQEWLGDSKMTRVRSEQKGYSWRGECEKSMLV